VNERDASPCIERLLLTAAGQRAVDVASIEAGVPSVELMESAGRSAAAWILDRWSPQRVVVLIGPGGNGGDGLVVARRLLGEGVDVRVLLLQPAEALGETSAVMLDRFERAGGRVTAVDDASQVDRYLEGADRIVDALFGSGLDRPLEGTYRKAVECLNASPVPVVSLDLPSGLASDGGELLGATVRADVTLAMAFLKPAHLLYPARSLCGNVAVTSVDYPTQSLEGIEPIARVPEPSGIAQRLPERRPDGHKGTFGRVLVVAGSVGMSGAAILCCRAALRVGTGLVTLAAPAQLNPVLEAALPEVITIPLPDGDGHIERLDDVRFEEAIERADVLAIGPGLSRATEAAEAVRDLVKRCDGSIVLDADGVAAYWSCPEELAAAGGDLVLTPHPGELGPLLGLSPEAVAADRIQVVRRFASGHRRVTVLKGAPTAIGLPEGSVFVNPTGNEGLGTGGTGDVLTGMIAGFLAGSAPPADAAILSAYVHGLAAETFARDRAARSLIASDLIELLPTVLHEVASWS